PYDLDQPQTHSLIAQRWLNQHVIQTIWNNLRSIEDLIQSGLAYLPNHFSSFRNIISKASEDELTSILSHDHKHFWKKSCQRAFFKFNNQK
ncbi:hypothetical protein O181_096828, partial [Austropuccinia psidii MF-1]|nr:hypothetical protein [Austropuccinia psidii MF-1]